MMILIFLLLVSTAFSRGSSSSSSISNINNVINNNNGDSSGTSNAAANSNNNYNNNKMNNLGGIGADTVQLSSRVVGTKYGSVSGVIVHLEGKHLEPVEAFKGTDAITLKIILHVH